MAYEELKSSGITEKTPGNITLGAGTIHKGFKFDPETKKWNFEESLIGATSGGTTFTITPEITNLDVDGALVKMKGLAVKTGETATIQTNVIELTPELIKMMVVGDESDSVDYEGYKEIVSRAQIKDQDYIENLAYVGHKIDGTPIIIIFDHALCNSGLSLQGQNKTAGVVAATFECYAPLTPEGDRLPYHILYPTPVDSETPTEPDDEELGA